MTDPKERLKKLRELALRGVGGEKEQAERLFQKLLKKYDLTEDCIGDDIIEDFMFTVHGKEQQALLIQVVYKVTGDNGRCYDVRNRETGRTKSSLIAVECTAAEKIEIDFLFDFYSRLWTKEKDAFFKAFIQKHQIFGELKPGEEGRKVSEEELMKLYQMMRGLSDETPLKQIADS